MKKFIQGIIELFTSAVGLWKYQKNIMRGKK
jgi:hypothetical protein